MSNSIKDKSKSAKRAVSKKMAPIKEVVDEQLPVVKLVLPLAMAILTLGLTCTDQGTDIASSYSICTTPCGCVWDERGYGCLPPDDVCRSTVINGTAAGSYCAYDIVPHTGPGGGTSKGERTPNESSCVLKPPYSPPTTCQCEWWAKWGKCKAPVGTCRDMDVGDGPSGLDYCSSIYSQSECEAISSWPLPAIHQLLPGVRHPSWCLSSMGTVIAPSVIANIMLLTM